ncbi:MAG: hypothetical protein FWD61_13465, partial [Phycisphaerales bacterium]|nr:hypothetical protein [Phycisphaerales bacterium]
MNRRSVPSLLDILPPEAQHLLGAISLATSLVGLILWTSGIKIARFSVALLLGLLGAAVGFSLIPQYLSLTPISVALIGFAAGVFGGVLAFKMLQGFVLALCIGVAAAGIFYHWHTTVSQPTVQAVPPATTLPLTIKGFEIPTDLLSHSFPATAPAALAPLVTAHDKFLVHWHALPPNEQWSLLIISLSAAIATFLLSIK